MAKTIDGLNKALQTHLDLSGYAAASHGTHVNFTTTTPKVAGTAAVGSATTVSRSDHVHPAQTTVSGNAGSATKLQTARDITIGNKTNSFNGTANISFTLADIGAAATGHSHDTFSVKGTNTITTTANDTTLKWGALGTSIHWYTETGQLIDQPSQYGFVLNTVVGASEVHQLWMTQSTGDIRHRGGNASGWNGTWKALLDSDNFTVHVTPSAIGAATSSHGTHVTWSTTTPKVAGTAAVGSETKVARGDHVHPLQTTVSGNAGSATKLATARTLTIGGTGKSFDGSANVSWSLSEIGAAAASHTHNYAGSGSAGGAANSATKLATARTINGTSFDGSANITTANWGTSRKINQISVNGSADVKIPLDHYTCAIGDNNTNLYHHILSTGQCTGDYTDKSITILIVNHYNDAGFGIAKATLRTNKASEGGTASGELRWLVRSGFSENSLCYNLKNTAKDAYMDVFYKSGSAYAGLTWYILSEGSRANHSSQWTKYNTNATGTNAYTEANMKALRSYTSTLRSAVDYGNVSSAKTADKLATARNITIGNKTNSFDGSAAISFSLADIGAAAASHDHNYIATRSSITCETGTNRPAVGGLSMSQAYNNGYPTPYGNVMTMKGAGDGQLLIGWSGTSGAHAPVYVRSKRDTTDANWSDWAQIYTTANKPTASDVGALPLSGGTMTGAIKRSSHVSTWVAGMTNSMATSTGNAGSFQPMLAGKTTNGSMCLAYYAAALQATYITKANVDAGTNTTAKHATLMDESGNGNWSGTVTATGGFITGGNIVSDTAITDNVGTAAKPFSSMFADYYQIYGEANKQYGWLGANATGTTSAVGEAKLILGNAIASGTASNAKGTIGLYGTSTGYTLIQPGNNSTSNVTITLPSAGGTLARTSELGTLSSLKTTEKGNLVAAINEVFQSGSDAKSKLVAALTAKGISASTSDSWDTLIGKLNNIAAAEGANNIYAATSLPATGNTNDICIVSSPLPNHIHIGRIKPTAVDANDIWLDTDGTDNPQRPYRTVTVGKLSTNLRISSAYRLTASAGYAAQVVAYYWNGSKWIVCCPVLTTLKSTNADSTGSITLGSASKYDVVNSGSCSVGINVMEGIQYTGRCTVRLKHSYNMGTSGNTLTYTLTTYGPSGNQMAQVAKRTTLGNTGYSYIHDIPIPDPGGYVQVTALTAGTSPANDEFDLYIHVSGNKA